jgi:hypothetical protein
LTQTTDLTIAAAPSVTVPVTLVCPSISDTQPPNPPIIVSISQTDTAVVCAVEQNPVTGSFPVASLLLYRGDTATGPFTLQTDAEPLSTVVLANDLYDNAPVFGVQKWYVAVAVDSMGYLSGPSNVVTWTMHNPNQGVIPGPFTPGSAALGPYPLLGSDIFIDPTILEGRVAPNGDLMTVNGLNLLAQDLSCRIRTEIGELPFHPGFGFSKGSIIGSGQAAPAVQAQILRANVIDCLTAEPRVLSILSVEVSQNTFDSWVIAYSVEAIGYEDPLQANLVVGYSNRVP